MTEETATRTGRDAEATRDTEASRRLEALEAEAAEDASGRVLAGALALLFMLGLALAGG